MDQERIERVEKCLQSQGYWAHPTDKTIDHPYKKGYKMRNNTRRRILSKNKFVVLLVITCVMNIICVYAMLYA